jgi:DNA polymerase elongation subunit (family B)
MISSGVVSMDFASLYPSTMTMKFPSKQSIRKKKIKNIFND